MLSATTTVMSVEADNEGSKEGKETLTVHVAEAHVLPVVVTVTVRAAVSWMRAQALPAAGNISNTALESPMLRTLPSEKLTLATRVEDTGKDTGGNAAAFDVHVIASLVAAKLSIAVAVGSSTWTGPVESTGDTSVLQGCRVPCSTSPQTPALPD